MARRVTRSVVGLAALGSVSDEKDGRTIAISSAGATLRAGRRLPGGEEAVLVRFARREILPAVAAARGQGFGV